MKNLLILVFISLMVATTAQDAVALTTARIYTNNTAETLSYRIFIPEKTPQTPIPLVIFLHGAGERGTDNKAQIVHGVGDLITYSLNNEPMIIIAPQCPENKRWSEVDWSKLAHTMPREPYTASLHVRYVVLSRRRGTAGFSVEFRMHRPLKWEQHTASLYVRYVVHASACSSTFSRRICPSLS